MTQIAEITGIQLSHKHTTQAELEAEAYPDPLNRINTLLNTPGVTEAFVLQTCNRIEQYVVAESSINQTELFADFQQKTTTTTGHKASLRHLLRVATGIESQLIGEDQILGQLRSAYLDAKEANAIGPILDHALLKAIHVGERARTDTQINEGIVSLGEAAVTLAQRHYDLCEAAVLIIGAGEMAELAASSISRQTTSFRIANRSIDHAETIASQLEATADCYPLDRLPSLLRWADIVITATGSNEPIIQSSSVTDIGQTLLIDIAQPHDVSTDIDQEEITIYDLDGLKTITEQTHESRAEAVTEVETIVEEELDLLLDYYKRHRADTVIKAMYAGAERIKTQELQRALSELDISPEDEEIVEALADAIMGKLMAIPTQQLRAAASEDDWETIQAAIELFEPSLEEESLESTPLLASKNLTSNS